MTIKITVLQAHSHKFLEKKVMYHDRTMPKEKMGGKEGAWFELCILGGSFQLLKRWKVSCTDEFLHLVRWVVSSSMCFSVLSNTKTVLFISSNS